MLIASIMNNDTAMMRACAEHIHKLETNIMLRKCSTAMYHILQPIYAFVWTNIGVSIGALILLVTEINKQTNALFLAVSLLFAMIGEFIIYYGIKIGNAIIKIIFNKSIKITQQRTALIIEQYRAKLTL